MTRLIVQKSTCAVIAGLPRSRASRTVPTAMPPPVPAPATTIRAGATPLIEVCPGQVELVARGHRHWRLPLG
ncbi:hypothetical protein [Streptomyces misionensis]|uniref:hypothetical protein n=1 Tax=Streptomyces misionensis TaxID=67331 RepID=UPI0036B19890